MDVRLKLAELQKSRKRQLPIDESSEMVEQQHRPENKMYGNVNCADLDNMVIPDYLIQKYGSSTLIYDSRTERDGNDVVFVFSHPRLLKILADNRQFRMILKISVLIFQLWLITHFTQLLIQHLSFLDLLLSNLQRQA
ncbi:hypothetical protein ACQ4LE_000128 [Meloidogyne hapla]